MPEGFSYQLAVQDFRRARRRASLEQIMAFLKGTSADLLSYEEVRHILKVTGSVHKGLQEIPLDAIVGSVGRYADFTRKFLPKQDTDETRWARIGHQARGLGALPPIEVYQINDVYFVLDGNHRVSVAREMGAPTIEAYVTEVKTKVPISKDIQPDDLILKAGYADFLEKTHIDEILPNVDFSVTAPGKYRVLREYIDAHHQVLKKKRHDKVSYKEAVLDWYRKIYLPIEHIVRQRGMLRDFPDRTITDLYLWIMEHREDLQAELGWEVSPASAATDLVHRSSTRVKRVYQRIRDNIRELLTIPEFEAGPEPGQWRREHVIPRREDRLFTSILVPLNGKEGGWYALEQAIEVARHEESQLYGLHIIPVPEQLPQWRVRQLKDEFAARCERAGIIGELAFVHGKISSEIIRRARWTDLVVMNVDYPIPKGLHPLSRFQSSLRTILLRCPRPILTVSRISTGFSSALLAYDGSPKANEALFVSAYLAGAWDIVLVVVTVTEVSGLGNDLLAYAKEYLNERQVKATFLNETGSVRKALVRTAQQYDCDLLIMGGYGRDPLLELFFGSTTNHILRTKKFPVLICR